MENDFLTTAEDDIHYGDEKDDEGNTNEARTMYLAAIAKAMVEIRDELRRINNGKT